MLQEFVQQVEDTARTVMEEIHTALPCIVISYDGKKNLAKVKPIGDFLLPDGKRMEYPEIDEVPVIFPYITAHEIGMVFPIHKKDELLLLISEVELDEWRSGAKSNAPLKYDLTSAVALPALIKKADGLHKRAVKNNALILKAKEAEIVLEYPEAGESICMKVKENTIKISEQGIEVTGNVSLNGNIYVNGTVTASSYQ